jgi:hypothetical protein
MRCMPNGCVSKQQSVFNAGSNKEGSLIHMNK